MKLLAIETATEACSVALYIDGNITERYEVAPRRHAELVLPMADELVAEAGIERSDLDAIAVGRGPGAFTGVRLAIAMAQGIALALDRPVVTVSTLAALALGATALPHAGATVLAAIDARMGEIYTGCFGYDADGLVHAIGDEDLLRPGELERPDGVVIGIGSGFATYGALLRERLVPLAAVMPDALPRASAIARLAARAFVRGEVLDAAEAQPVYLRDKVALTLAEQGEKSRA